MTESKIEEFKKENPASVRYYYNNKSEFDLKKVALNDFMLDLLVDAELYLIKDNSDYDQMTYWNYYAEMKKKYN